MKKSAFILVFASVLSLCAFHTDAAQTYPVTLCINNLSVKLLATYVGKAGGLEVYNLNGWSRNLFLRHTVFSGTATIVKDTIYWGLNVITQEGIDQSRYTFTTDFSLNLKEGWVIYMDGSAGVISVGCGPCTSSD